MPDITQKGSGVRGWLLSWDMTSCADKMGHPCCSPCYSGQARGPPLSLNIVVRRRMTGTGSSDKCPQHCLYLPICYTDATWPRVSHLGLLWTEWPLSFNNAPDSKEYCLHHDLGLSEQYELYLRRKSGYIFRRPYATTCWEYTQRKRHLELVTSHIRFPGLGAKPR